MDVGADQHGRHLTVLNSIQLLKSLNEILFWNNSQLCYEINVLNLDMQHFP